MAEMYSADRDRIWREAKNPKKPRILLVFRWFIISAIFLLYFFGSQDTSSNVIFLPTYMILVTYNVIVTSFALNKAVDKKYIYLMICIDIILVSVFCYQIDGINSDLYVLYFFIIGYCSVLGSSFNTMRISLLAVVSYSLSCIFHTMSSPEDLSGIRLLIKSLLIILGACGTSLISREIRKYNELHRKEFRLARIDKLTGLANRHYLEQKLKEEIMHADSSGSPLNVLIFDLDNFKKYNDTYGHIWGDMLLTQFSEIIKSIVRKSDIAVRYGGEEFIILIRDLDIVLAKSVGERIRRQLEMQDIYIQDQEKTLAMTVSCGIAQYPTHSSDIKTVIEYADKALYHAKRTGKNKVVCYDEIEKVPRTM